jgi:hypothetical protein
MEIVIDGGEAGQGTWGFTGQRSEWLSKTPDVHSLKRPATQVPSQFTVLSTIQTHNITTSSTQPPFPHLLSLSYTEYSTLRPLAR